ncbi:hypothetical protein [Serratia sp. UGAL515B_01]|nr:hypothetical protein [Serratia sp. UGAL515B_01]WON76146.1 hypothetical protein OK023_12965 [Serratia sp. UGAL515B_01]
MIHYRVTVRHRHGDGRVDISGNGNVSLGGINGRRAQQHGRAY